MTKEELTNEIAKKLKEIKELYYNANPNGDYLTLCIYRECIMFNNNYEEGYSVDYYEREDDEDEDLSI